jgi:hypothetical protein
MSRIDAKNDCLALELARGRTITEAASSAGISRKTVQRRLLDAHFRERVTELRQEMTRRALDKLILAQTGAADTLLALLDADSESVRLAAARLIVELSCRLGEYLERQSPKEPARDNVVVYIPDNGRSRVPLET